MFYNIELQITYRNNCRMIFLLVPRRAQLIVFYQKANVKWSLYVVDHFLCDSISHQSIKFEQHENHSLPYCAFS